MIKTATHDIKLYKAFRGSNSDAAAPMQHTTWGRLRPGRILIPDCFSIDSAICLPGVHASKFLSDAKRSLYATSSGFVWRVIIPKGTRYYESSIEEAQKKYTRNARGPQFRAEKIKLISQVKRRKS